MLFDTHLHLVYRERLSYPWLNDVPALNKDSDFATYLIKARKLGIGGCFHMEVDVSPDQIKAETEMVKEHMSSHPDVMRGAISSCRPESDSFPGFLESARGEAAIRGFRRLLHVEPDDLSQNQMFRDNVKRLSGTGLTFDICARADQLLIAAALVDHCPDVQFILDHCGVPDIAGDKFDEWAANIAEIARRANVVCKISGISAYARPDEWSAAELRPYFDHVVSNFGNDRIIWGSDSPVCNLGGGLENWVALTRYFTQDWNSADRGLFYSENAKAIWEL